MGRAELLDDMLISRLLNDVGGVASAALNGSRAMTQDLLVLVPDK